MLDLILEETKERMEKSIEAILNITKKSKQLNIIFQLC